MSMLGKRVSGWRIEAASVMGLCLLLCGCAQRPGILEQAGARRVDLRIARLYFPKELDVPRLIAAELGGKEVEAGVAVMTAAGEFEEELAGRFYWVVGFDRSSSEVSALDLSSFEPVLGEGVAYAPSTSSVHDVQISSTTRLVIPLEASLLNVIMGDDLGPKRFRAGGVEYVGDLAMLLAPKQVDGGVEMRFIPTVKTAGGESQQLEGLSFSGEVGWGGSLFLASGGREGSFGEAAFSSVRSVPGGVGAAALPLAPVARLALPRTALLELDQVLVVSPLR